MRKFSIALSLLLVILIVSGCYNTGSPSHNNNESASSPSNSSITHDTTVTPNTEQQIPDISIENIDTSAVQGDVNNIYYGNDNNVLILADKLYLYDLVSGQISSEAERDGFSEETYFVINNGFAVVGMSESNGGSNGGLIATSDTGGMICIIYDNNLNTVTKIAGNAFIGADEFVFSTHHIKVSQDGTKIAYASDYGLFVYDIESDKKTCLVNLLDENEAQRSGLIIFDDLAFVNGGNMIAFKSQSFDVPAVIGKPSFDTYGSVNIDGTGLRVNRSTDYSVKEMTAYDSFALLAEDFTVPSGRLMIWDVSSDTTRILTLSTTKESGDVFGSDEGQYFATASLNQDNLTVRVYETNTGAMVFEETITEESSYMSRIPEIRMFDNHRTCLVLLGNRQSDIPTKTLTFNF